MKTYVKFGLVMGGIVGMLAWLAVSGINESKTYYKTISELRGDSTQIGKRVRVTGDVVPGSIKRDGTKVHFKIVEKEHNQLLDVTYAGKDPLPDTFRDNSQAMADGRLGAEGTFHASSIAAKCPSKYEADPNKHPSEVPLNNSKPASI
jgi:cytochrome c-type biogenesis protein CcmE